MMITIATMTTVVNDENGHSWVVHAPAAAAEGRPHGLFVFISPGDRGSVPEQWRETLEKNALIWVGPNGAGKSTLLKILGGVIPIESGSCELGHNVEVGYFSQHRVDVLDLERTALEEAMERVENDMTEVNVRTLMGAFLFRGDDVFKKVKVLSGGEKSRLALIKLLLAPPNLLLLDEPTTHLDMPSIDAFIQALKDYTGTIVFVSHDVHFIRAIAQNTIQIEAGKITPYAGDYDYYLRKSEASSEQSGRVAGLKNANPKTETKPKEKAKGVNAKVLSPIMPPNFT